MNCFWSALEWQINTHRKITQKKPSKTQKLKNLTSKAWFPAGDKSRFYRQMGDK